MAWDYFLYYSYQMKGITETITSIKHTHRQVHMLIQPHVLGELALHYTSAKQTLSCIMVIKYPKDSETTPEFLVPLFSFWLFLLGEGY